MPLSARLLAVLIACLLIGLTPLAYADPPDPTWIAGYWDDDDFDDAVVVVIDSYAIQPASPAGAGQLWAPVACVEASGLSIVATPVRSAVRSRAPPLVSLPAS